MIRFWWEDLIELMVRRNIMNSNWAKGCQINRQIRVSIGVATREIRRTRVLLALLVTWLVRS